MESSVKKFQEIFNLPVTGIVDKATWYKIKYIYNIYHKILTYFFIKKLSKLSFKEIYKSSYFWL